MKASTVLFTIAAKESVASKFPISSPYHVMLPEARSIASVEMKVANKKAEAMISRITGSDKIGPVQKLEIGVVAGTPKSLDLNEGWLPD